VFRLSLSFYLMPQARESLPQAFKGTNNCLKKITPRPATHRSLAWILTNKKRPAATERSEQIQMEF
ncbi:hypothetical protein LVS61_28900, partial [Pseudomonas aeruginosa]|nr:hypothetical protein [Pseudomonas aeruginosa]